MSINILPTTKHPLTDAEKRRIYEIMIDSYASTEGSIWGENHIRLPEEEFFKLLDGDQMLIATWNDDIAGCINFYRKDETSFGFGLLCTHADFRNRGIGRALIEAVEDNAKNAGATYMKIVSLRARGVEVHCKVVLAKWYEAMGYVYTHSEDFADVNPDRATALLKPADFDHYRKAL
eukprot:gene23587-9807_t